jgi:hypothetical protein
VTIRSALRARWFTLVQRRIAGAGLLAILVGWTIYRPDVERPFHILDFSEFLPLLQSAPGVGARFTALTEYYADQGRLNLVPYAAIAVKYTLFGTWSPGWQLARAALMLTLVGLAFAFLRRVGASRAGAIVGAAFFLVAPPAAEGWIRLTMAEPLGAAFILAMSLRAARFQRAVRWTREVVLLGLGAVAVLLTKELLAPALLLPVTLALTMRDSGVLGLPAPSRRNVVLLLTVAGVALATLWPMALLFERARPASFAAEYGARFQSPGDVAFNLMYAFLPFDFAATRSVAVFLFTAVLSLVLILGGWGVGFLQPQERGRGRWLLAIAVFVPLCGVLAYLPWPAYQGFYALPYLTGLSLLAGTSVTWVERYARGGLSFVLAGWGALLLLATSAAQARAARTDATQRLTDAVVRDVARLPGIDSVIVPARNTPVQSWQGLGPTLERFASATGRPWPPTRGATCPPPDLQARPRSAFVFFAAQCPWSGGGAAAVTLRYRRFDWPAFRAVTDSVRADIVVAR